ncbi:MAG TPA: serine protease [Ktedonobacterales bacterium]|nr:serine protease [Ktedonobacterales bacterium]
MHLRPDLARTKQRRGAMRTTRFAVRLCGAIGVALLALALPFITTPTAGADARPPGGRLNDPAVRKVDMAEPAVVRIALTFNVRITLTLCGQDVTLPNSYPVGSIGSGAFISANGDILTADHVVSANGAEIVANPDADRDIANLLNTNPACHLQSPIGASDVANGFLDAAGINYSTHVSDVQHPIWQGTPYSGQIDATSSQSILQALSHVSHLDGTVLAESSISENDLAIVHVDLTDTPSIKLDDSSQVAADDQLTIIGFPGNGDQYRAVSDQTVDANDLLTPSVNNVTVSSIKSNSNGAKLIQVGGNVEHGDSGGPALDASGNIVGVVSFGTSDGTAQTVGNTSFLRSSDDVQPLITTASVNTAPGNFEKQWEQAFGDYAATTVGHWHRAARELDALANSYPGFKGIQPYRDYADKAAAVEQVPTDDSGLVLIISIFVALAALAAIILTVVLLRQRHNARLAAALAPASQGLPYGAYGPPSQFGVYAPPSQYGGYAPSSQYGGYAPPSQYGVYGPPSQYAGYPAAMPYNSVAAPAKSGPTVPYTNPAALPATAGAPAWPAAPLAPAVPGDTSDAPMGRMTFPHVSNPGYSPANGGGSGAGAGSQLGTPPFPQAFSADGGYGWPASAPQMQANSSAPAAEQQRDICLNGHSMPPGEVYCAMCGAPRTPTASS